MTQPQGIAELIGSDPANDGEVPENGARCDRCHAIYYISDWPFCPHGTPNLIVRGDDIPGGRLVENLDPVPTRYYTKSAIRQRMAELGVEEKVRHVGLPGSDKNPNTQRWV